MARRHVKVYWGAYGVIFFAILLTVSGLFWYQFGVIEKISTNWTQASTARSAVGSVWMEHAWVEPGKSAAEVTQMSARLKDLGMTDAFFHSGPLEADGTLKPSKYKAAGALLEQLDAEYPALRAQAWIGQVTTTWNGPLNLTNEETRKNIVASARQLLDVGFEGIHVNLEPILDEDADFLVLLRELDVLTESYDAVLSIASDDVEPFLGAGFIVRSCCRDVTFWKPAYLAKVFGFVDQVAVMTYDSSLKEDALYSWYVSLVTERLAPLTPEGKILFIGVPSFETGNKYFDNAVENITSGLRGVIAGSTSFDSDEMKSRLGVALYAYWETSEEEWQTYREYWQGVDK